MNTMNRIFGLILLSAAVMGAQAQIKVVMEYTQTQSHRGELYQYSERYLGPCDVITEEGTTYQLQHIYDANDQSVKAVKPKAADKEAFTQMPTPLSEEAILASSQAKKAEVVAKQIYRIREARINILSGEVDQLPQDGRSMELVLNELNRQERLLLRLFVGYTEVTQHTKTLFLSPSETQHEVLLRFSQFAGPVDKDNLSGEPVYLTVKNQTEQVLVSEATKKTEAVYQQQIKQTNYRLTYLNQSVYETSVMH